MYPSSKGGIGLTENDSRAVSADVKTDTGAERYTKTVIYGEIIVNVSYNAGGKSLRDAVASYLTAIK